MPLLLLERYEVAGTSWLNPSLHLILIVILIYILLNVVLFEISELLFTSSRGSQLLTSSLACHSLYCTFAAIGVTTRLALVSAQRVFMCGLLAGSQYDCDSMQF